MRLIVCDKGGREERVSGVREGNAARDFFYGTDQLCESEFAITRECVRSSYEGIKGQIIQRYESIISRCTGLGMRPYLAKNIVNKLQSHDLAISFTDGFSLTLGYVHKENLKIRSKLVGCFHRLCDIEESAPNFLKKYIRKRIKSALSRLDHVSFFGPADREEAIKRYKIPKEKTSDFILGIDSEFWKPTGEPEEDYFFSIGQDPQRDFQLLVNLDTDHLIRIQTPLNLIIPKNKENIILNDGNYYKSHLSDIQLRSLYCRAKAIVLPLRDVLQPTGYSVMLQAMSCAKPVIITFNRGFWARDKMTSGKDCIFVRPNNERDLRNAICFLDTSRELRHKIGETARKTILNYFPITKSADSIKTIIQKLGKNL